jgi:hypothetical protein
VSNGGHNSRSQELLMVPCPARDRGQVNGKRIVRALDGMARGATKGATGRKAAALHAAVIGSRDA